MTASALTVVVVFPDLLGTYGDGGNGVILARRAEWRGIPVDLVGAASDRPLPTGDLYCLGGGEDGPQVRAADTLSADGTLTRAVDHGAVVLAVCAGYQIAGQAFPGADGGARPGVGLLDVSTRKAAGPRAVGEVVAEPIEDGPPLAAGLSTAGLGGSGLARAGSAGGLPTLTGFENHGGVTSVGTRARPLARVTAGIGNGDPSHTEGAWSGRVVGTYLHGPVLARNPALADLLLGWATGSPLPPLDDHEEAALRAERLTSVRRGVRSGFLARSRRRWTIR